MIVIHLFLTLLDIGFFLLVAALCVRLVVFVLTAIGNAVAPISDAPQVHPSSLRRRWELDELRKHEAHMGQNEGL